MEEYKFYYPYKSSRKGKKFMVLTSNGKWLFFGDTPYEHYTEGHLDEKRRYNYDKRNIGRDKDRRDYNTAGFWSYWFLWRYKTYKEAYKHIQRMILKDTLK
jgi:hypothetical protein